MEIQDFLNISSQDPEIAQATGVKLTEQCQNPEFLSFLVNTLQSEEVASNEILLRNILIAFKRFATLNWKAFITALSDDTSKEAIIKLLFSLPINHRDILQDSFVQAALQSEDEFIPVFESICGIIDSNMPLPDVYTVLSMCSQFISSAKSGTFEQQFIIILQPIIEASIALISSDQYAFLILSAAATIHKVFILRKTISLDESFLACLSHYTESLALPGDADNQIKMKESILELLVALINFVYEGTDKTEEEDEIDEQRREIIQSFNTDIMPQVFDVVCATTNHKQSRKMIDSIITIFYQLVLYNICPEQLVCNEVFTNFIIPAAHLTTQDFNDFNTNPNVYIEQCFTDDNDGELSARVAASKFTYQAAKKYIAHYDPIEVLFNISDNHFDLEARIYLMCSYAKAFIVDPEIFEQIFDLLTTEIEPFVVATILRFISIIQPAEDPMAASTPASHFILNSQSEVVCHAAVYLLDAIFNEFGDKPEEFKEFVEIPYSDVFPVITNLSDTLNLPMEVNVLSKLFRLGGEEVIGAAGVLINQMINHWRTLAAEENYENEMTMEADIQGIASIVDSIPTETGLVHQFQGELLNSLTENINQYPHAAGIQAHVKVAALISVKLAGVSAELVNFLSVLMTKMNELGAISYEIDDYFGLLLGTVILNKDSGLLSNGDFINAVGQIIERVLAPIQNGEESDFNSAAIISPVLVVAACGCYSGIPNFFNFIDMALNILQFPNLPNKDKKQITWASFYLFSGALMADAQAALPKLMPLTHLLCNLFGTQHRDVCYRDLKCGFVTLTFLAKENAPGAFDAAGSRSSEIFDRFADEPEAPIQSVGAKNDFYANLRLDAIIPALEFPINQVQEFVLYQSVSDSMPL